MSWLKNIPMKGNALSSPHLKYMLIEENLSYIVQTSSENMNQQKSCIGRTILNISLKKEVQLQLLQVLEVASAITAFIYFSIFHGRNRVPHPDSAKLWIMGSNLAFGDLLSHHPRDAGISNFIASWGGWTSTSSFCGHFEEHMQFRLFPVLWWLMTNLTQEQEFVVSHAVGTFMWRPGSSDKKNLM